MVAVDESTSMAAASDKEESKNEIKESKATLDVLQRRLEELLSKQSLTEDAFIQQNMNAQMYIPISILASHHGLASLGVDIGMLLAASRRSDKIGIDEENLMVRPLLKHQRNTLILRDLPEGISEEELRGVFDSCTEKDALSGVKPDVNRTAFVTFASDESAQTAALWLRSQKLRGESIKCAVKSEHFLRSFFPAAPPSPAMPGYIMQGEQVMWGTPTWMASSKAGATPQQYQWQASPEMWPGTAEHESGAWGQQGSDVALDAGGPAAGGAGGKGSVDYGKGGEFGKAKDKSKGKGKAKGKRSSPPENYGAMMTGADFMGLNPGEHGSMQLESGVAANGAADGALGDGFEDAPEIGYTHEFRKYDRQAIIEVCNSMDEIAKPESYSRFEEEHPDGQALFRQDPCKDWAPLPTPQIPFMMSGEGRRGVDGGEYEGRPPRKGTGSSWSRGSRPVSGDVQEDGDWGDSWTEAGPRWRPRGWSGADKSWPEESWDDGWYWSEKEGGKGTKPRRSRSRSSSRPRSAWVEKGKSEAWPAASGKSVSKWAVKSKTSEAAKVQGAEAEGGESTTAAVLEPAANASEEPSSTAPGANSGEAAVDKKPSWADKVRQQC